MVAFFIVEQETKCRNEKPRSLKKLPNHENEIVGTCCAVELRSNLRSAELA